MTTPAATESFRVLLVPGDEGPGALQRAITRGGLAGTLDEDADPDRVLARLSGDGAEPPDAIVIGRLRGRTAVDLTAALRGRGVTAPILVVVPEPQADADDELERAALEAGAVDVVALGPARLAHRIRSAIACAREAAQARGAAHARDELLSIVSHDLRSPLNAIVLACDALDADIADAERKRYVAAVRRAGQRAERLLRDLLDVSRIESGGLKLECRAVSAKSVLDQVRAEHETAARDAGSAMTLEIEGEPGQVLADRDRLQQAVSHLVGNAIKHAPGAAISLIARGVGDAVELEVADRGPGIAAEALPHVFDRFWKGRTRRRGGAGLGLTIARGIVEAHGGTLRCASESGKGTRFTARLPRPSAGAR